MPWKATQTQTDGKQISKSNEEQKNTHDPTPTGSLMGRRLGIERLLEAVEAAERLIDGVLERAGLEDTAAAALVGGRRHVLPEERVVDVAWRLSVSLAAIG